MTRGRALQIEDQAGAVRPELSHPQAGHQRVPHWDIGAELGILDGEADLTVRRNEPYGPEDGVTHTLILHALPRRLDNVMLEVRNDLIADAAGQRRMAERLARVLAVAVSGPVVEDSRAKAG